MIVEDEVVVAEDIASSLRGNGYSVSAIAHNGADAIDLATKLEPDLVLMDIKINGDMDGIATAARIRSLTEIPIIYLTAHSDRATVNRAKTTLPSNYLVKPLREDQLFTMVEIAFSREEAAHNTGGTAVKRENATSSSHRTRIFIVERQPVARQGLSQLIAAEDDLLVCGEADMATQAVDAISVMKPDLILAESLDGGKRLLDLVRDIRERAPDILVMVYSGITDPLCAERVLQAGASGFVLKSESPVRVLEAIRSVLHGSIYVSREIEPRVLHGLLKAPAGDDGSVHNSLTERERQVFDLIGRGIRPAEMAGKLHLSIKTIETYQAHIKRKLRLKNANELLQYAIKWNQLNNAA